jgi:hypothetical protein
VLLLTGGAGSFRATLRNFCGLVNRLVFGNSYRLFWARNALYLVLNILVVFLALALEGRVHMGVMMGYAVISGLGLELLGLEKRVDCLLAGLKVVIAVGGVVGAMLLVSFTNTPVVILPAISLGLHLISTLLRELTLGRFLWLLPGCNMVLDTPLSLLRSLTTCSSFLALSILYHSNDYFQQSSPRLWYVLLVLRGYNQAVADPFCLSMQVLMLLWALLGVQGLGLYWLPVQVSVLHLMAPFIAPKKTPVKGWQQVLSLVVNILMTPWIWLGLPVKSILGLPLYLPCYHPP